MTVREFLEMCTQDYILVDLFDCGEERDLITINIGDYEDEQYEDIMKAEMMSWDIENNRICINYLIQ